MRTQIRHALIAAALLGGYATAQAASSAASEVSGSVSTSVGALSNSVGKSSDSSSKGTDIATGDYRVVKMDTTREPGRVRVTLQAEGVSGVEGELYLTVPAVAAERGRLSPGVVVQARNRSYGLEFATAQQTFFLALRDDWYRELDSRPVTI